MANLEGKLKGVKDEENRIREKINKRNKRRTIRCSCGHPHKIGDLKVIQTHWYTEPFGCTEGDYWSEGELQFVCPETSIVNRLLFDNPEVPYDKRRDYCNNPEEQFKRQYKHLFKEVVDSYDKAKLLIDFHRFANNHYVDENRRKFGLVEKRKSSFKK